MPVPSPGFTCTSDEPAINQKFPWLPLWVQLLCWTSSEFRKPIYSLDYQFVTMNVEESKSIARWKYTLGGILWVEFEPCMVAHGSILVSQPGSLWALSFWFCMGAIYIGMVDLIIVSGDWLNLQKSGEGIGMKTLTLIYGWLPVPIPRCSPKITSLT